MHSIYALFDPRVNTMLDFDIINFGFVFLAREDVHLKNQNNNNNMIWSAFFKYLSSTNAFYILECSSHCYKELYYFSRTSCNSDFFDESYSSDLYMEKKYSICTA